MAFCPLVRNEEARESSTRIRVAACTRECFSICSDGDANTVGPSISKIRKSAVLDVVRKLVVENTAKTFKRLNAQQRLERAIGLESFVTIATSARRSSFALT